MLHIKDKQVRQIRGDLSLLNRLGVVTVAALISAVTGDPAALLAAVLLHTAWPISVIAPMRWRNQISERAYLKVSSWFLPGLITVAAGAYGTSRGEDFPATALVLAIGAFHFLMVILIVARRAEPHWWSMAVGASVAGIAGVIADLPTGLGWNTLAMSVYGFVGIAAVAEVRDRISFRPSP